MTRNLRPRRLAAVLLAGAAMFALAACSGPFPNSTFHHNTEFNREIDQLFDRLMFFGTIVFVLVEALLIYVIIKYRSRPGQAEPKHVHGNTTLEVLWTAIPAIILVFIAIPTVRAIFRTQAPAESTALQVEVIGHQWWWEFRYPQFTTRLASGKLDTLTTANELYLPTGRKANFALRTADVLHSFWVPQLGGKRDLISNRTNFLWFTPDTALGVMAFNGHCAEYCGASHANMKFRAYTVTPAEFDSWVAGQSRLASVLAQAPGAVVDTVAARMSAEAQVSAGFVFPADKLPVHIVPATPVPASLRFDTTLVGDVERGRQVYSSQSCIGCHYIAGNPMSVGRIGPNLTHVGTRHTLAAGLFPNDRVHLAKWIKNARAMKPGILMPTLGRGEHDPITKQTVTTGGLTDQQIADIVAYLQALK